MSDTEMTFEQLADLARALRHERRQIEVRIRDTEARAHQAGMAEGRSLTEIGAALGVSASQARNIGRRIDRNTSIDQQK